MTGSDAPLLLAHMSGADVHTILSQTEGPAAEVINPSGTAPICIVCEHASPFIPASLNRLRIAPEHLNSHAAWDIGARDLSVALSRSLDAPIVVSRVSRLVYDCNRPPEARDAMPERSEVVAVPGNSGLSQSERDARIREVYAPFRNLLATTLDSFSRPPALVTIHSFTPIWHGEKRSVELGILHDSDDRLAKAMLDAAPGDINTQLNAPYSATDGVTHTLREHAVSRGLQNVMIEVRNDLISDEEGVAYFARHLRNMLSRALSSIETP